MFGDVPEVPKPLFVFLNSFFFLLFWLNAYVFLTFQIIDLALALSPSLLVPCRFFFISLSVTFISAWVFFILLPYLMSSLSILFELCTTVVWTLHLISNLSDCLSPFWLVLLLEFCSFLSFGPYFFVSSIWQPPHVCFCVLGRAALTDSLSSMAYYRKSTWKLWGGALGNHQGRATCFTALWLCIGGGLGEGTMPLPGFLRFAWHLACAIGTFPAVALVLNPSGGGSSYILSLCGLFKQSVLKIQQFLLLLQTPPVFTARSYGDLSSWCWNPGICSLAWGWDHWLSRYPSWFLPTTHECGTACSAATISLRHTASLPISASLPLLPVWMNVASLILDCCTSIQLHFLTVLGVICFDV